MVKGPWPTGLRVVFFLVVLGFLVSTGQMVYYGFKGEFFSAEIGGKWALAAYAISYVTITVGSLGLRRPFTLLLTAGCLYSIPVTAFLTWPMVHDFWRATLSGGMTLARMRPWEAWCLTWNTICLSLDIGVLLYLLSYEFSLFGPGKIERSQS